MSPVTWRPARGCSKYLARACVVDGIRFASKHEARRWLELRLLERAGQIHDLRRQVRIPLHAAGGGQVGAYVADFIFMQDGQEITEDAKGFRTELYKWKRRHVAAEYGIDIHEV